MYPGGGGSFGSRWQELYLLDRVLEQLTRPSLPGAGLPSAVRQELHQLGLTIGRTARRQELIERVWGRKRPLLRGLDASEGDPMPPCA
jgi:hypothetical protein